MSAWVPDSEIHHMKSRSRVFRGLFCFWENWICGSGKCLRILPSEFLRIHLTGAFIREIQVIDR